MEEEFDEAVETEVETEEQEPVETEEQPEETETEEVETQEEPPAKVKTRAPVVPRDAFEAVTGKLKKLELENEDLRKRQEPAQKREPQTIEEHFDANPEGVLTWVNQQISAAQAAYDDDKVRELQAQKTDLVARGLLNQQRQASVGTLNAEMYKAVPDFDAKRPQLQALAVEYGLNEKEAADILNPAVVGETAVRMAKMLNKAHTVANAGKTAKTKEVKKATKVEPAGNGGFSNNNTSHKQLERAKASGSLDDWASVLG
jgi:hypothetical protein